MTSTVRVLSQNEEQTDALGAKLASVLTSGLTIALNGQLGSGKTRLTRSLCAALGIDTAQVTSPTFVLMQLYTDGRLPVAHFDTYRLGDVDEFVAIGAEEYFQGTDWVCLIEWAERVDEILPSDRLTISIRHESETARVFELTSSGTMSNVVLENLRDLLEDKHSPSAT